MCGGLIGTVAIVLIMFFCVRSCVYRKEFAAEKVAKERQAHDKMIMDAEMALAAVNQ